MKSFIVVFITVENIWKANQLLINEAVKIENAVYLEQKTVVYKYGV